MGEFEALAAEEGGLDFWDIHLGLGGEMRSDGVERVRLAFLEESIDGAFAGVIRGQGQAPVFEAIVEVVEVMSSGGGAFVGLVALVEGPPVEAITLRGRGHELEEARSADRTSRARIEAGFHLSDPDEFRRYLLRREDGFEARDIGFGAGRPRSLGELLDPDLALFLGRWIGDGFRGLTGLDFGRGRVGA